VFAARLPDQATLINGDELPGRVYHYISTDGLLGILGSGQLRATDLRYLNDTSELHFGLTEMLRAYETVSQVPSRRVSLTDQLAELYGIKDWQPIGALPLSGVSGLPRERFDPVANAIVNSLEDSIIIGVACFCGEGDLLSQWRGYSIGGYALGFDAHALRGVVKDLYLPLAPVVYGRPPVRKILRSVSERADELLDDESKRQRGLIRTAVTLPLLGFAAQIKHPTFDSEKELRLGEVALAESPLWQFRSGALGVIPYVDIDLRQAGTELMPLREVCLAPGPEVALRETAVRALLRSKGYPLTGTTR
jgi:hypothetical protein